MRRALTPTVTLVVLAALAAFAPAQERTHVRDVRVGAHGDFDRIVVELDGPADIAWERGPQPGEERFYLDADLGSRARVIPTKLAQVGKISLRAMRVGTQVSLEPRERRVRAYLLANPIRLVIDLAAPTADAFAVPKGVTPLAPAKSIGPLENAPVPEPEPARELEPAPTPAPPPPQAEAAEPTPPEPTPPEPEAAAPAAEPAPIAPEVATPEALEVTPAPAPEPAPASEAFPWVLALVALASVAALVAIALVLRRRAAPPRRTTTAAALRATQIGVDAISTAELRCAADPTSVLEQRLDDEVRARIALEERLAHTGEELKVLRDRLHRVERRREDAL